MRHEDRPWRLRIPVALAAEMLAHARAARPHEACGLLSGSLAAGRATMFHPARNEHESRLRFSVHPEDLVRIVLGVEVRGDDLVAVFHSHVGSAAVPSPTDVREARYPDVVHVLATLTDVDAAPDAALRAWRIRDGTMHEVPLVVG